MGIPRSWFAGAVTVTPAACSSAITPDQLDASAKAPWTRTTVGEVMMLLSIFVDKYRRNGFMAGLPNVDRRGAASREAGSTMSPRSR